MNEKELIKKDYRSLTYANADKLNGLAESLIDLTRLLKITADCAQRSCLKHVIENLTKIIEDELVSYDSSDENAFTASIRCRRAIKEYENYKEN